MKGAEQNASTPRAFDSAQARRAYRQRVLNNRFFEADQYYHDQRSRYLNTLRYLARLPMPRPARVLEVGGGQISLLASDLWGDVCTVADVNDQFADSLCRFGIEFVECDLLRDDLPFDGTFDLLVLCEVAEHLPVPLHLILEKTRRWLKGGGWLLLTTPNLYRIRNAMRLLIGKPVFSELRYPERGRSLGHPLEYSRDHLLWQLNRAGYESCAIEYRQLVNHGSSWPTHLARMLITPLHLRPLWRDHLVAVARNPVNQPPRQGLSPITPMDDVSTRNQAIGPRP